MIFSCESLKWHHRTYILDGSVIILHKIWSFRRFFSILSLNTKHRYKIKLLFENVSSFKYNYIVYYLKNTTENVLEFVLAFVDYMKLYLYIYYFLFF